MSLLLFLSGFSVSSCAARVRKLTERTTWHQFFSPLNIVSGCWNSCLHGFTQTSFLQINRNRNNPMVENSSWSIWCMSNCVCMRFPLALLHKKHMSAPHTSLWNLSNSIWHLVGPVSYVHWIKKNCFSLGVFHVCACERKRWKHKETGGIKDRTTTTYLRGRVLNLQELMWYNFLLLQPTVIHTMTCMCSYGGKNTCWKSQTYRAWRSRQTAILYQRHPSMWRLSRAAETGRGFVFKCFGSVTNTRSCVLQLNHLPGFQKRGTWARRHTADHNICREWWNTTDWNFDFVYI